MKNKYLEHTSNRLVRLTAYDNIDIMSGNDEQDFEFRKIRAEYIDEIQSEMKQVLENLEKLDRHLKKAASIGGGFKDVEAIWKNFYDPTFVDELKSAESGTLNKTEAKKTVVPDKTDDGSEATETLSSLQFDGKLV